MLIPGRPTRAPGGPRSARGDGPASARRAMLGTIGSMTDPELIQRAEAAGVAPCYSNWRHERIEVGEDTLAAILDALDALDEKVQRAGPAGPDAPDREPGAATGPPGSGRPRLPDHRSWGFTVQLYSVRSRRSWGHGDLRDLADLAAWSARPGARASC